MSYGPTAIYAWLAKPGDNKTLVGAAFLLTPDLAITCAHVIREHLGLGESTPAEAPLGRIRLRFPALGLERAAQVIPKGWFSAEMGSIKTVPDVALLRLAEPVIDKGLSCVPLANSAPPGLGAARIYGAGPGWQNDGQEIEVKLGRHINLSGRWQLTACDGHGFVTEQGFSGAPVFDDTMTVVWGMVQQVAEPGTRVALALGADRLQEVLRRADINLGGPIPGTERPGQATRSLPEQMRASDDLLLREARARELQSHQPEINAGPDDAASTEGECESSAKNDVSPGLDRTEGRQSDAPAESDEPGTQSRVGPSENAARKYANGDTWDNTRNVKLRDAIQEAEKVGDVIEEVIARTWIEYISKQNDIYILALEKQYSEAKQIVWWAHSELSDIYEHRARQPPWYEGALWDEIQRSKRIRKDSGVELKKARNLQRSLKRVLRDIPGVVRSRQGFWTGSKSLKDVVANRASVFRDRLDFLESLPPEGHVGISKRYNGVLSWGFDFRR